MRTIIKCKTKQQQPKEKKNDNLVEQLAASPEPTGHQPSETCVSCSGINESDENLKASGTELGIVFLRLKQIIGDPKKGIPPMIPVSASAWWAGVKKGIFPAPLKLSPRCTVWKYEEIMALADSLKTESKK